MAPLPKKDALAKVAPGVLAPGAAARVLEDLLKKAAENLDGALSENTRRSYARHARDFDAWCTSLSLPAWPTEPPVLLAYLTMRGEERKSGSYLTQAYAAIREQNRLMGHTVPTLEGQAWRSWLGARKKAKLGKPTKKARALLVPELQAIVRGLLGEEGVTVARDRALLLVGFCAALRREEICALDLADISVVADGLKVVIRKSKTDQEGNSYELGIARGETPETDPVLAWTAYRDERECFAGSLEETEPAFVSYRNRRLDEGDIGDILKKRAKAFGVPTKGLSAHSLRAGCITAAAEAGHALEVIQRQSRHKSLEVLLGYIRTATLFKGNVTKGLV